MCTLVDGNNFIIYGNYARIPLANFLLINELREGILFVISIPKFAFKTQICVFLGNNETNHSPSTLDFKMFSGKADFFVLLIFHKYSIHDEF